MASADHLIALYRELADWNDRQGQAQLRDRFLVLAADAALAGGRTEEAETIRRRLLQLNPHHLLRPFATFAQALRASDVQTYVGDLRQSYPPDAAEHLLESLRAESGEKGNHQEPSIEATLPVVQLPRPPADSLASATQPLKVYPLQSGGDDDDEEMTRTLPASLPLPAHDRTVRQPTTARNPQPLAPPPVAKRTVATPAHSQAAPPTKPRAQPVPTARPAPPPPIPLAAPARPVRPPEAVDTFRLQSEPPLPFEARPAEKEEHDGPSGAWVPYLLSLVLLVVGLLLGGLTLLRPFLPNDWFR